MVEIDQSIPDSGTTAQDIQTFSKRIEKFANYLDEQTVKTLELKGRITILRNYLLFSLSYYIHCHWK